MAQKIFALAALMFVFSFFRASAEETTPAPPPAPSVSASVPMPDVSDMVNIAPRIPRYRCPNGDIISVEGYVKKGNEGTENYDVRRLFLGEETVPYAASVLESSGDVERVERIVIYLDFERDGTANLVAESDDSRLGNICTAARKTQVE